MLVLFKLSWYCLNVLFSKYIRKPFLLPLTHNSIDSAFINWNKIIPVNDLILPVWALQNSETLTAYSYFHRNKVICIGFNKNLSSFLPGHNWKHWVCNQAHIWGWCSFNQIWRGTFQELRLHSWSHECKAFLGRLVYRVSSLTDKNGKPLPGRPRKLEIFMKYQEIRNFYRYCRWNWIASSWLGYLKLGPKLMKL